MMQLFMAVLRKGREEHPEVMPGLPVYKAYQGGMAQMGPLFQVNSDLNTFLEIEVDSM